MSGALGLTLIGGFTIAGLALIVVIGKFMAN